LALKISHFDFDAAFSSLFGQNCESDWKNGTLTR
jgi:hypothetical protein